MDLSIYEVFSKFPALYNTAKEKYQLKRTATLDVDTHWHGPLKTKTYGSKAANFFEKSLQISLPETHRNSTLYIISKILKNEIFLTFSIFSGLYFFHILSFHFGKDFENPYQKKSAKKIGQKVKIMKKFHFLKFHK